MAMVKLMEQRPVEPEVEDGSLPRELTYDPTQGVGTSAWQRSLAMSAELNARERRN